MECGVDVVLHVVHAVTVEDAGLPLALLLLKHVHLLVLPPVRLLVDEISNPTPLIVSERSEESFEAAK